MPKRHHAYNLTEMLRRTEEKIAMLALMVNERRVISERKICRKTRGLLPACVHSTQDATNGRGMMNGVR